MTLATLCEALTAITSSSRSLAETIAHINTLMETR